MTLHMTASSISKHSYVIQIKIISCPNSTTFRSPVVIFPSFWTSRMSSDHDLDSKLQTHESICLKKQTGQSPRRLVAYLLIRCIICRPELKNLQNVWELKQTYYPVLTRNALKLQPRTKLLRQFHLFSNFCALLPSPLNTKSKPPPLPLFKVALV